MQPEHITCAFRAVEGEQTQYDAERFVLGSKRAPEVVQ
jgi:hypothetical protein